MKLKLVVGAITSNDIVDVFDENGERLFSLDLKFVSPAVVNEWKCAFDGNIPQDMARGWDSIRNH